MIYKREKNKKYYKDKNDVKKFVRKIKRILLFVFFFLCVEKFLIVKPNDVNYKKKLLIFFLLSLI